MRKKQTQAARPFVESFAEKAGLNRLKKSDHPRLYYLSGAITNDPHYKLKFDLAETYLVARGDLVVNPVKYETSGRSWSEYIADDLHTLERMRAAYMAVLPILNRISGKPELRLPCICLIDLDDRAFPSKGSELERAFAGDYLPTVKLGEPWPTLLSEAIAEAEKENGDGLA